MKETSKMVQDGIQCIKDHPDSYLYQTMALDKFTKAAQLGDSGGMNCLGTCYERGYGCDKDLQKAHFWWRRAAELGHRDAMFCVAYDFYKGRAVDVSFDKAQLFMKKSKDKGYKPAIDRYELWFNETEEQKAVREGRELAVKAAKGDRAAKLECAIIYYQSEEYDKTLEYCSDLFEKDTDPDAAVLIGSVFEKQSNDVRSELETAYRFFYSSMEKGGPTLPILQYYLASFLDRWWREYDIMEFTVEDEDVLMQRTFDLCLKAAKSGLSMAQTKAGNCYRHGIGVEKNCEEAAYWFESASDYDVLSDLSLGFMLYEGEGIPQDYERAFSFFSKGYDVCPLNGEVLYYLGICYYNGRGTDVDIIQAGHCFKEAVRLGCEDAEEPLKICERNA